MRILSPTLILISIAVAGNGAANDDPPLATRSVDRTAVKLPGMTIDLEKRCVDLEATVCLSDGFLELVACRKGSKEHESIVAISARPMHVHTALLLLGAHNGNPAMRKPVGGKPNEEKTTWIDVPPRGDSIDVFLLVKNAEGKVLERPIGDFIRRAEERAPNTSTDRQGSAKQPSKFRQTFLFAGSQLRDAERGPREYLADSSGNVISIVTFGDAILCLPEIQSAANGALSWRVDATHLPKVGEQVTLRLRPKKKPDNSAAPSVGKSAPQTTDKPLGDGHVNQSTPGVKK